MWTTMLRRGAAAGVLAGVLAALVGLLGGTQTIDEAEALAHADDPAGAAAHDHDHDRGDADHDHDRGDADHDHDHGDEDAHLLGRGQQKAGFAAGTVLLGTAGGLAFGGVSGWCARRGRPGRGARRDPLAPDDGWARSLGLGAAAVGAVVVLPALAYPPVPPGGGDPDTVTLRTGLYLLVVGGGVLLALGARTLARRLAARGLDGPERHTAVAAVVIVLAAGLVSALPSAAPVGGTAADLPAELVWRFRLEALATQVTLWGGIAVAFGLLSRRAVRASHPAARRPVAANGPRGGAEASGSEAPGPPA